MMRLIARATVVCLALLSVPVRAADVPAHTGADKLGWKLTLQSWTVKGSVFMSLDYAQKIGVRYIEIHANQPLSADDKTGFGPSMTDGQIKAVLDKAESYGVQIIDTGVMNIPAKEPEARKTFEWAKKMGITTIVSEPDPAALPMIDGLAGEYGIQVAIHDHPKPSRYWDPEFTWSVIKDLKHVGYCADVGHWKRSGLDPVEVLKKHGDRVVSMHFKDLVAGGGQNNYHDVPWGAGESKAAEMLAVMKEKGFKGPIAIEYEWKWDVTTLRKCVDFFNEDADKLAAE